MRRIAGWMGAITLLIAAGAAAQDEAGYSIAPLLEPSLIPQATLPEQVEKFTAWAEAKYPTMRADGHSRARERGQALVDAIVKQRAAEGRADFTAFERGALHALFTWNARFGGIGADRVAAYFAPDTASADQAIEPPPPFRIALDYPSMAVSADGAAWRLRFPFYFPIQSLATTPIDGGYSMHVLTLNTSFGPLRNNARQAPAILMFAHSGDAGPDQFSRLWRERHGLTPLHAVDPALPGMETFKMDALRLDLQIELTLWNDSTGSYAVLYMGRNGAFEMNRVSYLDFMRHARADGAAE